MKRSIQDYFASKPSKAVCKDSTDDSSVSTPSDPDPPPSERSPAPMPSTSTNQDLQPPVFTTHADEYDIGLVDKSRLTISEKLKILGSQWTAPPGFQWPYTERLEHSKTRRKYLGEQHLSGRYRDFSYSLAKEGIYCKACVLFAPDEVSGSKLDRLVKSPLQKYAHLTGKDGYLSTHLTNNFHQDCIRNSEYFSSMVTQSAGDVSQQLQTGAAKEKERNRASLKRIILCMEFLGRLGLPFRGHRDCGTLNLPEQCSTTSGQNQIVYSQGNFRATLQLMVACNDEILRKHLETTAKSHKTATYISPQSQNELINCFGIVIQRTIINQIKKANYFSLLADETTDVSRKEQLTVCVRYIIENSICERFFCFAEAPDLTGSGLASQLLEILKTAGIDTAKMVGQGYDGAAAMSGQHNGVQKHVRDSCPAAVYVHCQAHALNLCLLKASENPEIRKCITMMQEITNFYHDSNKRTASLQASIHELCPAESRVVLKKHCATRWVERQEAVGLFKDLLPAIKHSLDQISLWPNSENGSKALILLAAIDGVFHLTLEMLCALLDVTKPLSEKLQRVDQDVHNAMEDIDTCLDTLVNMRNEETFANIFARAESTFSEEIVMPRTAGRQKNRANPPAATPEEYYRRAMYLPYIDTMRSQINVRFAEHSRKAFQLSLLLPAHLDESRVVEAARAAEPFLSVMSGKLESLETEVRRWCAYWLRKPSDQRPTKVLEALRIAQRLDTYPLLTETLHIFATLPVTTATGERSFNALKLIKNYLRSTMSEPRLNGLALMRINTDIPVDHEEVVEEFGRSNRRLHFT